MSFFDDAAPWAQIAHTHTGVLPSVILAQWADETGYRWPAPGNNPGNVGNTVHGGQVNFSSVAAGVDAYIQTMNLPYYAAVRAAPNWVDQCYALGRSPWAAGHYNADGGPPGEDLVKIVLNNDLATHYDSAAPIPNPTPARKEDEMLILETPTKTYLLIGSGKVYIPDTADGSALNGAGIAVAKVSDAFADTIPDA